MEKRCLIILPKTDPEGYPKGHFNRVYQYIVVPACRFAGFTPSRADDPIASDTSMDILKNIVEYEVVLCDLSSNFPLSLYGFAIRQGLNLPAALMHDTKSRIAMELKAMGAVEYDESLRIDTVQNEIEALSKVLTQTFDNRPERNSLLNRLEIGTPPPAEAPSQTVDVPEAHLPVISPIPDDVGEPMLKLEELNALQSGDEVFHINYGKGKIKVVSKMAKDKVARIEFDSGSKLLVLIPSGIFRKIKGK
ncbi:MAG: hypothetical protein JNL40_12175 [Cyclobacteriaceae bacterium]|nr:hypothetical protein [Cyclobacteriaceae bacterium]